MGAHHGHLGSRRDRSRVPALLPHRTRYEDWVAWSQLFTDDASYLDHFYGTFRGPSEIQKFLESTMSFAPHVYSPLVWYNLDGSQIVYKVVNRADNPEPGGRRSSSRRCRSSTTRVTASGPRKRTGGSRRR